MPFKVLVVARKPNALGLTVDEVFEFATVPRIGELVCVSSKGVGVDVRVTEVIHSPCDAASTVKYDCIDVWGEALDGCYQY